ncbi:MAG: ABC transporter permease [Phycisphaerales bacterium]|nr:ABC transporter permease [Phycisphaerales bacterium]
MNKIWAVAWREFRHTVLTKAFLFGVVIAPIFFFAVMIGIAVFLKPEAKPLIGKVGVVSPNNALVAALEESLKPEEPSEAISLDDLAGEETVERVLEQAAASQPDSIIPREIEVELVPVPDNEDQINSIKDGIRNGTWTALIIVDEQAINADGEPEDNRVRLYVAPDSPPSHTELLEDAAREALTSARVAQEGLDPQLVAKLTARPRTSTIRLVVGGDEKTEIGELRRFLPLGFMGLIWLTTFISGNYLLTSTIEEKSNRVMEVLLSAISPMQLMAGKILGYAMVTVIMVAMFSLFLIGLLVLATSLDLISPIQILLSLIYLVMAYLMVAAMMAGIGSAVSDMRDAQTLLGPVSIAVMIPLLLSPVISEDPNGLVAMVTSYIPPLTPFVMVMRLVATEPISMIEIALSMVWGFFCSFVMIWLAARIFRVGVLMQGKPPSPMELIRWARYR